MSLYHLRNTKTRNLQKAYNCITRRKELIVLSFGYALHFLTRRVKFPALGVGGGQIREENEAIVENQHTLDLLVELRWQKMMSHQADDAAAAAEDYEGIMFHKQNTH